MPYVSVSSSQHIAEDKAERLQKEIGRIISIIPGKTIDNCMIQITGDVKTYMGGSASNSTFCEIRMFGKAPGEAKKEFNGELHKVLAAELEGLGMLYVNYQEYFEWGIGPNFREAQP